MVMEKSIKNGILLFEGIYSNDKRSDGIGKEYHYSNGDLLFDGEYKNEKRWKGHTKEYYYNKLRFEGEYEEGEKIGKEYNSNGKLIYEGEYKDDKKWNGKVFNNNGKLEYEFKDGKKIMIEDELNKKNDK